MLESKFLDLKQAIASKLASLSGYEAKVWEPPAVTGSNIFTMFSGGITWNEPTRTKTFSIFIRLLKEVEGDDYSVQEEIDYLAEEVAFLIRSDPSLGGNCIFSRTTTFDHTVAVERRIYHVLEWRVEAEVEEVN